MQVECVVRTVESSNSLYIYGWKRDGMNEALTWIYFEYCVLYDPLMFNQNRMNSFWLRGLLLNGFGFDSFHIYNFYNETRITKQQRRRRHKPIKTFWIVWSNIFCVFFYTSSSSFHSYLFRKLKIFQDSESSLSLSIFYISFTFIYNSK